MELRETFPKGKLQFIDSEHLEEGKKSESLGVNGLFALSDFVNGNGRKYPMKVLQQAIAKMQNEIELTGPVYSLDGYPKGDDDSLKLERVSHSISEVWQSEDEPKNEFYRNLQILPTTAGKNLFHIIKAGGSVGLSMRGIGECRIVMEDGKKVEVVEKFVLQGIDTVLNPSFSTARVNKGDVIGESLSIDIRRSKIA